MLSSDNTVYYVKHKARNDKAKSAYMKQLESGNIYDIIMCDIIREKIRLDDPCLVFDYVTNDCLLDLNEFMDLIDLFIASGYADGFGKGNPKYAVGLSGTELVLELLEKSGKQISLPEPRAEYDCSPEYWCGWSLAYFINGRRGDPLSTSTIIFPWARSEKYMGSSKKRRKKFADTVNVIIKKASPFQAAATAKGVRVPLKGSVSKK